MKHYRFFALLLLLMVGPCYYAYSHTDVYYNLDSSLPDNLPSIMANTKLTEEFDMGAVHMVLVERDTDRKDISKMIEEMKQVDGVNAVLSMESFVGPTVPEFMIPESLTKTLKSDNWELMLITNEYATASEEVNAQVDTLNTIIHKYDPGAMLIGEAPCTKDLITITDHDFAVVSAISILAVFGIILVVFGSVTLPLILVAVIEFAIFMNLGIPYVTGTVLPFIASIVISTIQLGATVDYAILMTGRYEKERCSGKGRYESVYIAHRTSVRSVIVSALSFFAATFGVGLYSGIDMISSLCTLMSRGAIISMFVVLLVLPSMLMIFDPIIARTSFKFRKAKVDPHLK